MVLEKFWFQFYDDFSEKEALIFNTNFYKVVGLGMFHRVIFILDKKVSDLKKLYRNL